MGVLAYFILALIAAVASVVLISAIIEGISSYRKFRGQRVIVCPENNEPAAVEVSALRALSAGLTQSGKLQLRECSRWPEMQGCGQECLSEVEESPEGCLVRSLVSDWYRGKSCAVCGSTIHEIEWLGQRPALRDPEGKTVSWDAIAPEKLPEVFRTHAPVCWDCHIATTLLREHPEVVTYRPWTPRM